MHSVVIPAAVVLVLIGLAAPAAEAAEPRVGELHPELRLPTLDGTQTISLRSLRGKRVLLLQFASW
ncbi:MAG: hypothetical protein QNJ90_16665 [Planctomycetota bacterium]|nr:hypothetical protein [Planctomycetota bacterium]